MLHENFIDSHDPHNMHIIMSMLRLNRIFGLIFVLLLFESQNGQSIIRLLFQGKVYWYFGLWV